MATPIQPHWVSLLLLISCLVSHADPASAPLLAHNVAIQAPPTERVWEGWGTSLCWWANVYGERDDLADLLFTLKPVELNQQSLPGLGMTIARYNVGACSDRESGQRHRVKSKTIRPYREMEGFWLDESNADPSSSAWDWSVDRRQRAMLQKAKERGATHFELFSNSPMWWMCANQNPSGAVNPREDNLSPAYERNFAIYMAEVARYAKLNWGITFTTIEPFNEPTSAWWDADCKQEGCHFSPASQVRFLPLLREELDRRGLDTLEIAASDENLYSESLAVWDFYPPAVKALVAQVNVHGYQYKEGPRAKVRDLVSRTGQRLWNSEHGDGDSTGLLMARCLALDIQELQPTAWCYWQPIDEAGWGFIQGNLFDGSISKINPKFYVAAQFLRHIRPGMVMLATDHSDAVAALDKDQRRLVVVLVNDSSTAREYTLDLAPLAPSDQPLHIWTTRPSGPERYTASELPATLAPLLRLEAGTVLTVEVGLKSVSLR